MGKASRKKDKAPVPAGPEGQGRSGPASRGRGTSPTHGQQGVPAVAYIQIVGLLILSFAVYSNALSGDFIYDDEIQVVGNPWIRDASSIPAIFSSSVRGYQKQTGTSNYYRPLMHVVYMINYGVFGLKPWGFHLVNILLHCGATVLVFLILRRLLPGQGAPPFPSLLSAPLIAAAVFAVHPVHTEAVTWIAAVPEVGFTFFYLLSLYLYMASRDAGDAWRRSASVLSFAVAALFKEPALTLPVILFVCDAAAARPGDTLPARLRRYMPYVAVAGLYLLVRYYVLRGLAPQQSYADLSTYEALINIFPLFGKYLLGLLWPFNLNLWHAFRPVHSLSEPKAMLSLAATALFILGAVAAYRKNRLVFLGLLLIVIPLAPAFYIKAISLTPFSERYLYLPSVGLVLVLGAAAAWAGTRLPRRAGGIAMLFLALTVVYAAATVIRNNVWQNALSLWTDTVRKSPDNADARNNLGLAYAARGQVGRAIPEYEEAVRLKPDFIEAHNNLGNAYQSQGQLDKAIPEYQAALRLKPDFADAHYNLGLAYASQRKSDKAVSEFQATLRLRPDFAPAHNDLGVAYASLRQMDSAVSEFQAALRLKPDFADAHYNLGLAYAFQRKSDMAKSEFETVLRLRPDYREARERLNEITPSSHQ